MKPVSRALITMQCLFSAFEIKTKKLSLPFYVQKYLSAEKNTSTVNCFPWTIYLHHLLYQKLMSLGFVSVYLKQSLLTGVSLFITNIFYFPIKFSTFYTSVILALSFFACRASRAERPIWSVSHNEYFLSLFFCCLATKVSIKPSLL